MSEIDDERAEDALTELHTILTAQYRIDPETGERVKVKHGTDPLGFAFGARDRLAAAKVLLDFTKKKPTQSSDVTLNTPEAFLEALAEQEEIAKRELEDGQEAPGDLEETQG